MPFRFLACSELSCWPVAVLGLRLPGPSVRRSLRLDRSLTAVNWKWKASTTLLNRIGSELAADPHVHALTDVTGFGILGHGLEMARASGLTVSLSLANIPFLSQAETLSREGFITGASERTWASYSSEIKLPDGMADWQRLLLADPQTSGGLLVACDAASADSLVKTIRDAGYPLASIVGYTQPGPVQVEVRA